MSNKSSNLLLIVPPHCFSFFIFIKFYFQYAPRILVLGVASLPYRNTSPIYLQTVYFNHAVNQKVVLGFLFYFFNGKYFIVICFIATFYPNFISHLLILQT